jgi:hypothetical protein
MLQRVRKLQFAVVLMLVGLSFFTAGHAFAWQFDQSYASGLWPATNWAPTQGRLRGDGGIDSQGKRATQPLAQYVRWNQQAINWARDQQQWGPAPVSITFHSNWNGNTGPTGTGSCSNWWRAVNWASTNLPSPTATVYNRNCGYTFANEIRIWGNIFQYAANTDYFAQSWYQDTNTSSDPKGQFNVDTYFGGSANYHQKYCIPDASNVAQPC